MIEHDLPPDSMSPAAARELMRHELAHACGSLVAGATAVRITDDGSSWRSDAEWSAPPDEFSVLVGFLSGPRLVPAGASGNDRLMMAVVPDPLKSRVLAFIDLNVAKVLAEFTDEAIDAMAVQMVRGEGVMIRQRVTQ